MLLQSPKGANQNLVISAPQRDPAALDRTMPMGVKVPVRPAPKRRLGWGSLPLWVKLVLLVNLLLIAAVASTGLLTYKVSRDLMREEIITAGRAAVVDFASSNTLDFLGEQAGRLNLNLRAEQLVRGDKARITAVRILGRDSVLIAKAGRESVPLDIAMLVRLEGARVIGETSTAIAIAAPVIYGGVRLGTIIFDFSSTMLQGAAREILIRSTVIISTLMVLSAIFLMLMLRRLMLPVVELGEAAEAFATGDYSHRISSVILSGDEVGRAAKSFNNMLDALELHMRFSNGALIDRIRHGGTDQAHEFQLTIAFGDAAGYTSWSQKQTPSEVFATLSRYFSLIGGITVHGYNGIIDKFIGDGVMTHFGLLRERHDPRTADPESVRDALRAIVTCQLGMRVLSHAIGTYEMREPLAYRFGIASGRCLVGAVGARDVMLDYSVIGNVVNLASRLEHLAPIGGLLIDRFTHIDAGAGFVDVVDGGMQSIKGVSVPIQVFFVRGISSPVERERMRSFLMERFFTDEILDSLVLAGKGTREARTALRNFLARELKDRPELPVNTTIVPKAR